MTDFLRLPHRVNSSTFDVDAVRPQIESGQVVLDWTNVEEVDHDTGVRLFEPFLLRLEEFGDALGINSISETIEPIINWIVGAGPQPGEPVRAWMVLQAEQSIYGDSTGEHYEYPPSIPNGRQMRAGDLVVCINSSKDAVDSRRVFGVATIGEIVDLSPEMRRAVYLDYQ